MEDDEFYPEFYVPQSFYLKVSGGFVSWGVSRGLRLWFPNRKRGGWIKSPPKKRKQSKLEKARKRSIAAVATVFARLEKHPCGFMTLAFDRDARESWHIDECLECFRRFRRYLERRYPKCWFIFVMEWSPDGFHFHLAGRLGQKPVPLGELRSKWQKITGSSYHWAAHFKAYNPELHHCYLTKKKTKAARTRKLMCLLGRRSFWGCIHRKQMPLAPIQKLVLDEDQMAFFRSELNSQIVEHGGAESSLDRLRTDANRLCFNTPAMVKAAVDAALAFDPEEATV